MMTHSPGRLISLTKRHAVLSYNNACQNFPGNLVANNFGFKTAEYLEIEQPEKRAVPKVSFS
jgi:LemA protein